MPFENPWGYWEYAGEFSVILEETASADVLPPGLTIEGGTVRTEGRVQQSLGAINFHVGYSTWHWRYDDIICIRDRDNNLLWVNRRHPEITK